MSHALSYLFFTTNLFMTRKTEQDLMTVGELLEKLQKLPKNDKIFFGCYSLEFYRIKHRGPNLWQIEFNQTVGDDEKGQVFVENHD